MPLIFFPTMSIGYSLIFSACAIAATPDSRPTITLIASNFFIQTSSFCYLRDQARLIDRSFLRSVVPVQAPRSKAAPVNTSIKSRSFLCPLLRGNASPPRHDYKSGHCGKDDEKLREQGLHIGKQADELDGRHP